MNRGEKAKKYFLDGYACAQSVVLAFNDILDISEDDLKKISIPFGGGLSRLRLTCGCISGMAIVIGLLFSDNTNSNDNKTYVYSLVQNITKRFNDEYNTLSCEELLKKANLKVEIAGKPEIRTDDYYKVRPCTDYVYNSAIILERFLKEKGIEL